MDEVFIEHLLYQALSQVSWDYKCHMKHMCCPQGASSLVRETELEQGTGEEITAAFNVIAQTRSCVELWRRGRPIETRGI